MSPIHDCSRSIRPKHNSLQAERTTRVGTLIKGQLNIVHVHDEVSVLSDVSLDSLSKGKGWPVTFITVYRYKDNKEKGHYLFARVRCCGCGCGSGCCCCCLVVVCCCCLFFVVGGCLGGCGFVWWVLCDVPLRRCVVVGSLHPG